MKILVVEDDPDLSELYGHALRSFGYEATIAIDGESAVDLLKTMDFALAILDVDLGAGEINGFDLAKSIRESRNIPIIFATSHAEDWEIGAGFESGADAYLTKPISMSHVNAQIRALLARAEKTEASDRLSLAPGLDFSPDQRLVWVNDEAVELTKIQFDLFSTAASDPKRVFTRGQLIDAVWGDWYSEDHHLDVHISRLRAKILAAGGPRIFRVVRGVGFRLV